MRRWPGVPPTSATAGDRPHHGWSGAFRVHSRQEVLTDFRESPAFPAGRADGGSVPTGAPRTVRVTSKEAPRPKPTPLHSAPPPAGSTELQHGEPRRRGEDGGEVREVPPPTTAFRFGPAFPAACSPVFPAVPSRSVQRAETSGAHRERVLLAAVDGLRGPAHQRPCVRARFGPAPLVRQPVEGAEREVPGPTRGVEETGGGVVRSPDVVEGREQPVAAVRRASPALRRSASDRGAETPDSPRGRRSSARAAAHRPRSLSRAPPSTPARVPSLSRLLAAPPRRPRVACDSAPAGRRGARGARGTGESRSPWSWPCSAPRAEYPRSA